jgi:hypothetical protein
MGKHLTNAEHSLRQKDDCPDAESGCLGGDKSLYCEGSKQEMERRSVRHVMFIVHSLSRDDRSSQRTWYFSESSAFVPFPSHPMVPTPYVITKFTRKATTLSLLRGGFPPSCSQTSGVGDDMIEQFIYYRSEKEIYVSVSGKCEEHQPY